MTIKTYIIPAASITVECEEGTDVDQCLRDLLYIGCEADDPKTQFSVIELTTNNIYPATLAK